MGSGKGVIPVVVATVVVGFEAQASSSGKGVVVVGTFAVGKLCSDGRAV